MVSYSCDFGRTSRTTWLQAKSNVRAGIPSHAPDGVGSDSADDGHMSGVVAPAWTRCGRCSG